MKPIYVFLILAVSGLATANFLFENRNFFNHIPHFAPRLFNAEKPIGKEQYSVALLREIEYNSNCTATVISKHVLISGAKFFTLYRGKRLQVYFPASKQISNPLTLDVQKVYVHPNFTTREKYHDIALIGLKPETDIYFNFIKPIPLLTNNHFLRQESQLMKVLGYGITYHKNSLTSGILKSKNIHVDTDIVDLTASILVFRDVDLSYGDAGAPLIMNGKLVGVAIYTDTHKEGFPGIFTGIVNHYKWIERTLLKINNDIIRFG